MIAFASIDDRKQQFLKISSLIYYYHHHSYLNGIQLKIKKNDGYPDRNHYGFHPAFYLQCFLFNSFHIRIVIIGPTLFIGLINRSIQVTAT